MSTASSAFITTVGRASVVPLPPRVVSALVQPLREDSPGGQGAGPYMSASHWPQAAGGRARSRAALSAIPAQGNAPGRVEGSGEPAAGRMHSR